MAEPVVTERYTEPERAKPAGLQPTLALVLRSGDMLAEPARHPLREPLTLGRLQPALGLQDDVKLSANHARLWRAGDAVFIEDLKSTNGTYRNGQRISEGVPLQDRDVIRVGRSLFVYRTRRRGASAPLPGVVSASVEFAELVAKLRLVALSQAPVLLRGETGTGKEILAQAIGRMSPPGPFVALNCARLTSNGAESALFGHRRGAFTGALEARLGAFRQADRGTLFLDEIGELPLETQATLLRVLAEKKVTPMGGDSGEPVTVRLITATHRDLDAAVRDGMFREDLLARIAAVPLQVPPLRQRREDILPLWLQAEARWREAQPQVPDRALSVEEAEALLLHPFPMNVREVESLFLRLQMDQDDLCALLGLPAPSPSAPPSTTSATSSATPSAVTPTSAAPAPAPVLPRPADGDCEGWLRLLQDHGTVSGVARALQLSTRHVRRILQTLQILEPGQSPQALRTAFLRGVPGQDLEAEEHEPC